MYRVKNRFLPLNPYIKKMLKYAHMYHTRHICYFYRELQDSSTNSLFHGKFQGIFITRVRQALFSVT